MVSKKEFEELNKKIRSKGLVMSRVPKKAREEFIKLADEEFESDYGMTLAFLIREYSEKRALIEHLLLKLDALESEINKLAERGKKIKLLDGSTIKL